MKRNDMSPEIPAEGILKRNDWGDSKWYRVDCECGNSEHNHDVWVEADDCGIAVTIHTRVKSKWWSLNRWKTIWGLLTRGYVEYEATICMTSQQTLNYSKTLESAMIDVEDFRKRRKEKNTDNVDGLTSK